MSASGATGAWNLAQELKELYPTDTRISEAVNKAANRLLVMGTSLHSNGRFADASVYYELLLSDPSVKIALYTEAEVYYQQSQKQNKLRTAEDMYNESISAYGATTSWNIALELKGTFPHSSRVKQAINNAAQRLLTVGINSHKNNNFSDALYYYNLLLAEPNVDSSVRSLVTTNANLATKGIKLRTPAEYYKASTSASGASSAWSIALEGLTLYPGDTSILSA